MARPYGVRLIAYEGGQHMVGMQGAENNAALLRELEDWLLSQPDDRPMFEVIVEAVVLPFYTKMLDNAGAFTGGEPQDKAARAMLDEIVRWTAALQTLRS